MLLRTRIRTIATFTEHIECRSIERVSICFRHSFVVTFFVLSLFIYSNRIVTKCRVHRKFCVCTEIGEGWVRRTKVTKIRGFVWSRHFWNSEHQPTIRPPTPLGHRENTPRKLEREDPSFFHFKCNFFPCIPKSQSACVDGSPLPIRTKVCNDTCKRFFWALPYHSIYIFASFRWHNWVLRHFSTSSARASSGDHVAYFALKFKLTDECILRGYASKAESISMGSASVKRPFDW